MAAAQEKTTYQTPQQDSRGVFLRLLQLLRPHWGMSFFGMVLLALAMPCELFPALIWKYVTDDLILTGHARPTAVIPWLVSLAGTLSGKITLLMSSLVWLFVVYVIGEVLGTAADNVLARVGQKVVLLLRNTVYHKIQCQSLGYLQRQRTGDLMSRAMGDVDEIQALIVNGVDAVVGDGLRWLATVAIVMLMNWKVASISLAPMFVVYVMLRVFNRRISPIYKAVREKAGDVSTRIQENLSGIVVIKVFGREQQEEDRFRKATEAYYEQQVRAINARSLFFPFSRSVGFFSNIFMIGVGGYLILTTGGTAFTVGELLAFRAYWWRLFGPIQTMARVNDLVQRAVAASRRIFEVMDHPDELPDAPGAAELKEVVGAVELRDVTFAYQEETPGAPNAVLRDVSIHIAPGQTVALCGPSGSGKSTILNLLLRFYDPQRGDVTLDGHALPSINRSSLRRHFALVQQETFLFNDSIRDNIRYGHTDATMEQVVAAAKAANAHGFISKLPNGYDTRVGERGVRLSGGQKQRISIARAFLANPSILLLDEPTSSVEPDSEAAIIAALDRLMVDRTTVLTSHRPSLIQQADLVYVIEDGRVTEQGTPAELMRRDGWFARFMRSAEESVVGIDG